MEWLVVLFILALAFMASGVAASPPGEPAGAPPALPEHPPARFDRPERVTEAIGQYMGGPIYRSVFIDGLEYFYDRVAPFPELVFLDPNERCISPGIVYRSG